MASLFLPTMEPPMTYFTPRFRATATYARLIYDDRGEQVIEEQKYDLVLKRSRLTRGLNQPTATLIVRETLLHRYLASTGWHLASVTYTLPLAAEA